VEADLVDDTKGSERLPKPFHNKLGCR